MLNHGNLKRKSRLLKYYCFPDSADETDLKKEYKRYKLSIENVPGIDKYWQISEYLHDAFLSIEKDDQDIIFNLEMFKWNIKEPESFFRKMIFKNAKIISWNLIHNSGRITRLNKKVIPGTYLYDEIYSYDNHFYITIIVTPANKICTGAYYPLVTIRFESISVKE